MPTGDCRLRKALTTRPESIAITLHRGITGSLLVVCGTMLLTAAALTVAGYSATRGLGALVAGSVGSVDAFLSGTLVRSTPLMLTGLAVALAFRAGLWNIGAEGQLLAGAAAATGAALAIGGSMGAAALPVVILAGALAGAAVAGIAAVLRSRFGVIEVISTIMLNFVAIHGTGWLVRGPLQEPSAVYPQSASIPAAARIPLMLPDTRLHWGVMIAVLCALVAGWGVRHLWSGFRLRAAGANPFAAQSAGRIDISGVTTRVFLLSGALAGVAGAVELTGVTHALYENFSPGWGYSAIAVALLARLDPWLVMPSALMFGALQAGAGAMQRDAGVPFALVGVVEALLILAILAAAAFGNRRRQL